MCSLLIGLLRNSSQMNVPNKLVSKCRSPQPTASSITIEFNPSPRTYTHHQLVAMEQWLNSRVSYDHMIYGDWDLSMFPAIEPNSTERVSLYEMSSTKVDPALNGGEGRSMKGPLGEESQCLQNVAIQEK